MRLKTEVQACQHPVEQSERKQVFQDLDVFFTFTQVGLPPDQQGQLCNPPLAMQVAKKIFFLTRKPDSLTPYFYP